MEYNPVSNLEFDCSDEDSGDPWRQYSQNLFLTATSWNDIVNLWVKFYSNSICLPTYYGSWIGDLANPYASIELGRHYAEMSLATGLIFDDGQQGSIGDRQREYLRGFAPASHLHVIRWICDELNRHSGLVGFWWFQKYPSNDDDCEINNFWVTYEDDDIGQTEIWTGEPFTRSVNSSSGPYFLMQWLNPELQERLLAYGFIGFEFVDTIHGQNRIVPTIENLLQGRTVFIPRKSERLFKRTRNI